MISNWHRKISRTLLSRVRPRKFVYMTLTFLLGYGMGSLFSRIGPPEPEQSQKLEWSSLKEQVKVLCAVITFPEKKVRAVAVKNTWGKRCDKLLFFSGVPDPKLPTTLLANIQEGRNNLWPKTRETFKYIYKHHLQDADWFLKADDDTFVAIDNLKLMLKDRDPDSPVHFGAKFHLRSVNGYMSGGAGYVLSREAVRRLVEVGFNLLNLTHGKSPNKNSRGYCRESGVYEDAEMGNCLAMVDVQAGDSRDQYNRSRFFPFPPEDHMTPRFLSRSSKRWFLRKSAYPQTEGLDCCSETFISFHNIPAEQMYAMEFMLYRARPLEIHPALV